MPLTVKQIESAIKKSKAYKLQDQGNLYLYITPRGTKSWRLDYTFNGKRKTLTLGKYPFVTLAKAREKQSHAKKRLASGYDPGAEKRHRVLAESPLYTFERVALEWYQCKKASWSSKYSAGILTLFRQDIFPHLGQIRVSEITPPVLLRVLKMIEARGAIESANKARMRCSEVFRYAIVTGRCEYNPASELANAMMSRTPQNYPFLTEIEMKSFLKDLKGYSGSIITRLATFTLIYSATRTVEMRHIKWQHINFEERLIILPAEIIKKNRIHSIPLSRQLMEILFFLKPITGHGKYVFRGRSDDDKPISDNAVLGVIKRLGYANRASGHGFRHQFCTVLNEHGFNENWIEKQLNHETRGIRGIYNHAQYLEQRRKMMQWYADYIDRLAAS